jgi:hypothetical protein
MKPKKILLLSILSSVIAILYCFLQWKIIDIVTPFFIVPVWLLIFGYFGMITVFSIITLFKNKVWIPITIQIVTFILFFTIPFTTIALDRNFEWNKSKREKIVQMVEKGVLKPNSSEDLPLIKLPSEYQFLSSGGGEIMLEKLGESYSIVFFTYRGIGNFSGFVYTAKDQKPSKKSFGTELLEIDDMDKNWYFVSSK